jgi:hypothetical protein
LGDGGGSCADVFQCIALQRFDDGLSEPDRQAVGLASGEELKGRCS